MNKNAITLALMAFIPSIALAAPANQDELETCYNSAKQRTSNLVSAARLCAGVQSSQLALDCFTTARGEFALIVPAATTLCEGVIDLSALRTCVNRARSANVPDEVSVHLCSQK